MEDSIKVAVRSRPLNDRERSKKCDTVIDVLESTNTIVVNSKPEAKSFIFDYVVDESGSQESVFQNVGVPLTESCLEGYNGTIIAYGQTGSGKTHTLFGNTDSPKERGLVPRVFEHLWQKIHYTQKASTGANIPSYSCKCSFYEIYNERVFDLLEPLNSGSGAKNGNNTGLNVREDAKAGVFVDGITEKTVDSPTDATAVMSVGYKNRHVSSTAMNRDSSRSHAVFLLTITVSSLNEDGLRVTNNAAFSLVDLAGSERQKSTQTEGLRLKEASNINKSLSTLGSVIHALSTNVNGANFVRYRDSVLTFLLRDSLGGNSKTVLIANISPSIDALSETLGTLKFAQRAKTVRNMVSANISTSGNVEALQREVRMLRSQLQAIGEGNRRGSFLLPPSPLKESSDNNDKTKSALVDQSQAGKIVQGHVVNPFMGILQSIGDPVLLSKSMDRFKSVDEARHRAELKVHSLQRLLETAEQSLRELNDKIMTDLDGTQFLSKLIEEEEEDIPLTREALKLELLKYKHRCDELERMRSHLHLEDLWTRDKENEFSNQVTERLGTAEQQCMLLETQFASLSNGKFEKEVGISFNEVKSMKSQYEALIKRVEEAEKKNAELNVLYLESQMASSGNENDNENENGTIVNAGALLMQNDKIKELSLELEDTRAEVVEINKQQMATLKESCDMRGQLEANIKQLQGMEKQYHDSQEQIRRLEGQEMQYVRDMEKLTYERDQAWEQNEATEAQCQSLMAEKTDYTEIFNQQKTQMEELQREVDSSNEMMNSLKAAEVGEAKEKERMFELMECHLVDLEQISKLENEKELQRKSIQQLEQQLTTTQSSEILNRSALSDMQNSLQKMNVDIKAHQTRETDLLKEREDLLVEMADKQQCIIELNGKHENILEELRVTQQSLQEAQNQIPNISIDNSHIAEFTESELNTSQVKELQSKLLTAYKKLEQNSELQSNMVTLQSEMRAVKLLYESSKQKATDAEERANAMMAQLVNVDNIRRGSSSNAVAGGLDDVQDLREMAEKSDNMLKKVTKERNASREVLSQVEQEMDELKTNASKMENMLTEVRMENTRLRESNNPKIRETKEIARLKELVRDMEKEIKMLTDQKENNISLEEPKDADFESVFVTSRRGGSGRGGNSKIAASDDANIKPAKRRGLSSRNGNVVPSLANLPPPPAL